MPAISRLAVRIAPLFLFVASFVAVAQSAPADPAVWGPYSNVAGTRLQSRVYELRWHWSKPGVELVEEFIYRTSNALDYSNVITPGPVSGQLRLVSSYMGKEWLGTLQGDGSVLWIGSGLVRMPYRVSLGADGTIEMLKVRLRDGGIASVAPATDDSRFVPIDAASLAVAQATFPAAETTTATPPASAAPVPPAEPAMDPQQLKAQNALNRAYFEKAVADEAKRPPGRWLHGIGASSTKTRRDGDEYLRMFQWVDRDGNLMNVVERNVLDTERGTWTRTMGGAPNAVSRAVEISGDGYTKDYLLVPGVSPPDAVPHRVRCRIQGDTETCVKPDGTPSSHAQWVTDEVASAALAQIAAERHRQYAARLSAQFDAVINTPTYNPADEQDDAPAQPSAAWQALQNTLADAQASEARSRAALDDTLAQAASQAATEREAREEAPQQTAQSAPTYAPPVEVSVTSPSPSLVVSETAMAPAAPVAAPGGGQWFVYCVAIQPGAYMDAPGAVFLSEITAIDSLAAFDASTAADAFGAAVSAKYGAHPGSASCNPLRNRADAQSRWQEQRDSAGLTSYRKVETGLSAVP